MEHRGTYSPEDNKLRLYPAYRLPKDEYNQLKAAGFKWAPRQELFVAPMWTPGREDILTQFCGEIEDEDQALVDRAEIRAERFEYYSEKRETEAGRAKDYVHSIADNIPFGQPILVGHHSEKRARKDAERIENGMRKAVKLWETSKYWKMRAAGALRHAKYKELPAVRARRIKGIEAEKRKHERYKKRAETFIELWTAPGVELTIDRAKAITNYMFMSFKFPLDEYPRDPSISQYEGDMGLWSALDHGIINAQQAMDLAMPRHQTTVVWSTRWISHCENRLIYEKAMLDEQGAGHLIEKKPRPKQLPLLNYKAPGGVQVKKMYGRAGEVETFPQIEMTKAEYGKIHADYKGTREVDGTHRVRISYNLRNHTRHVVFITDSKTHPIPEPAERVEDPAPANALGRMNVNRYQPAEKTEFDAMKDSLRAGVKTVSAPQLFVTPKEIGREMIKAFDKPTAGRRFLEPSAGTGGLVKLIADNATGFDCCRIVAVESNYHLVENLKEMRDKTVYANESNFQIIQEDFLQVNEEIGLFDGIIMNPPFENAVDIKHIQHALQFLKVDGRLVSLCADGPRQRDKLKPIAELTGGYYKELPAGSFKASGTNVNVAMVVINGGVDNEA